MNGWDHKTSVSTQGKLIELGLDWLRDDMLTKFNELSIRQGNV